MRAGALLILCLLSSIPALASLPCQNYRELLRTDHMDLGVRFPARMNSYAMVSAVDALNYWASVLDMSWHVDQTDACSISLEPHDWHSNQIGGAHLPEEPEFNGVLQYLPDITWDKRPLFVHEIGHLMGLEHNPDLDSVMQPCAPESSGYLLESDIEALFKRHKRR